jgi:hypothetical protein
MNLEEARALIARVDAADKAGVEFTDEVMREFGYVQDEGGTWELPIPVDILRQLSRDQGAKLLLDIESVVPVEPFKLRIQFGSGECKVVDIYTMRGTNPMFAPLWNWEEFKKVRFTPDVVEWFRGLKALEIEGQDLWAAGDTDEP